MRHWLAFFILPVWFLHVKCAEFPDSTDKVHTDEFKNFFDPASLEEELSRALHLKRQMLKNNELLNGQLSPGITFSFTENQAGFLLNDDANIATNANRMRQAHELIQAGENSSRLQRRHFLESAIFAAAAEFVEKGASRECEENVPDLFLHPQIGAAFSIAADQLSMDEVELVYNDYQRRFFSLLACNYEVALKIINWPVERLRLDLIFCTSTQPILLADFAISEGKDIKGLNFGLCPWKVPRLLRAASPASIIKLLEQYAFDLFPVELEMLVMARGGVDAFLQEKVFDEEVRMACLMYQAQLYFAPSESAPTAAVMVVEKGTGKKKKKKAAGKNSSRAKEKSLLNSWSYGSASVDSPQSAIIRALSLVNSLPKRAFCEQEALTMSLLLWGETIILSSLIALGRGIKDEEEHAHHLETVHQLLECRAACLSKMNQNSSSNCLGQTNQPWYLSQSQLSALRIAFSAPQAERFESDAPIVSDIAAGLEILLDFNPDLWEKFAPLPQDLIHANAEAPKYLSKYLERVHGHNRPMTVLSSALLHVYTDIQRKQASRSTDWSAFSRIPMTLNIFTMNGLPELRVMLDNWNCFHAEHDLELFFVFYNGCLERQYDEFLLSFNRRFLRGWFSGMGILFCELNSDEPSLDLIHSPDYLVDLYAGIESANPVGLQCLVPLFTLNQQHALAGTERGRALMSKEQNCELASSLRWFSEARLLQMDFSKLLSKLHQLPHGMIMQKLSLQAGFVNDPVSFVAQLPDSIFSDPAFYSEYWTLLLVPNLYCDRARCEQYQWLEEIYTKSLTEKIRLGPTSVTDVKDIIWALLVYTAFHDYNYMVMRACLRWGSKLGLDIVKIGSFYFDTMLPFELEARQQMGELLEYLLLELEALSLDTVEGTRAVADLKWLLTEGDWVTTFSVDRTMILSGLCNTLPDEPQSPRQNSEDVKLCMAERYARYIKLVEAYGPDCRSIRVWKYRMSLPQATARTSDGIGETCTVNWTTDLAHDGKIPIFDLLIKQYWSFDPQAK